jgi:hypothetical protein
MWQDEFETAGCVGFRGRKAGELDARGDLANLGDLATEHEETAGIVKVRGVVVWVPLVEHSEVVGIEFLASVVGWCRVAWNRQGGVWAGAVDGY